MYAVSSSSAAPCPTSQTPTSSESKAFPVKNTFIHFDITDDNAAQLRVNDGGESASSEQRLIYWLPSLSSSSGSQRRPLSADGRSHSSSEGGEKPDFQSVKRAVQEKRAVQALEKSLGREAPAPAGAAQAAPAARAPPAAPSSSVAVPAAATWADGFSSMLHDIWQRPSSSGAPPPPPPPPPAPPGLMDSEAMDILRQIPRNAAGHLTSMGSTGHEDGDCNPCPFWFKGVCLNGLACHHCHFIHEGQRSRRLRPSKQGRQRLKKRLEQEGEGVAEPSASVETTSASKSLATRLTAAAQQSGLTVASAIALRHVEEPPPAESKMSL